MSENEIQKDEWFIYCDRCGCKIYDLESSVDEDGLIYCIPCYEKLLETE